MSDSETTETPAPSGDPAHPKTFAEMNLDPAVHQALEEMGYEVPMEVQTVIFNRLVAGVDMMVQSRTGSGKTAGFGIPIAQMLTPGVPGVQALILAPTRELALQVAQELGRITAYRNLQVVPVYGGAPMGRQIEALRAGAQVVAGTPGRVLDHIRRGTLKTDKIRILVLDECDEMLSMGFQEEIEKILAELPPKDQRQTLLFSATIPEEIERIGRRHMRVPEKVVLSADYIGVHEISHRYYLVSGLGRTRDLLRILEFERPESALVFCNTREDTATVAAFLGRNGYDAEAISSDLSQTDRERVMGRMRAKELKFLVATDIAARGIDISGLPFVINYTFPESPEVYIHRTGRTGRAGASGTAISLVGPREIGSFYYLKLLYKIRPEERELPTEAELRTRREGERYAGLSERLPEDPGEEWRALARRVWESAEGERLVAAMVKRTLEGAPAVVAVAPPPKASTSASGSASESAATTLQGVPAPRPRREERPRRERERGERGERGERRREERPRREARSASAAATATASASGKEAGAGGEESISREFWETWVDEKAQKGGGAPAEDIAGGERRRRPERPEREKREPVAEEPGYVRLYVNVGKREGLGNDEVAKLFEEHRDALGKVSVFGTHTYVSVKEDAASAIVAAMSGKKLGEREIVVEKAKR